MQSKSDKELFEKVTDLSTLFDNLCQQRHIEGEIDEGALHFLQHDNLETLLAELVNVANNARYAFINLALAQDYLRDAPIGVKGFKSTKKNWKGNGNATSPDSAA